MKSNDTQTAWIWSTRIKEISNNITSLLIPSKEPRDIMDFGSEIVWNIEKIMDHQTVGYRKNVNKIKHKKQQDGYYWVKLINIQKVTINSIEKSM